MAKRAGTKFYVPSNGPDEWVRLLAKKEADWKTGHSAKTLAYCWFESQDFPRSVRRAFAASHPEVFGDVSLLMAVPEHGVSLPGGSRQSKNDLLVLANARGRLMVMTVEGKVEESFDELVSSWLQRDCHLVTGAPSEGKKIRLQFLCERLGTSDQVVINVHYQLLHRTVSALLEAKRFTAPIAVMLIHSFSVTHAWFDAYETFAALFGVQAKRNVFQFAGSLDGVDLYLAWVTGEPEYLAR